VSSSSLAAPSSRATLARTRSARAVTGDRVTSHRYPVGQVSGAAHGAPSSCSRRLRATSTVSAVTRARRTSVADASLIRAVEESTSAAITSDAMHSSRLSPRSERRWSRAAAVSPSANSSTVLIGSPRVDSPRPKPSIPRTPRRESRCPPVPSRETARSRRTARTSDALPPRENAYARPAEASRPTRRPALRRRRSARPHTPPAAPRAARRRASFALLQPEPRRQEASRPRRPSLLPGRRARARRMHRAGCLLPARRDEVCHVTSCARYGPREGALSIPSMS
jgi:hypothetical protein